MNQNDRKPVIRESYNAGRFYPSDPGTLRGLVKGYIESAPIAYHDRPDGIISPHAGYIYSGHVAGHAYRQLFGHKYDTVIVLAPSHFVPLNYVSIMPEGFYRTPLGDVRVDSDTAKAIADKHDRFKLDYEGHINGNNPEHSLEVQIPFLQETLDDFKIVPIVIGHGCLDLIDELGNMLSDIVMNQKVLLVASTDLSHFHDYDEANRIDHQIIDLVKNGNVSAVVSGCQSGEIEACGYIPVAVLLTALGSDNAHIEILKHANSGDVPGGSSDRVVGYLTASMYKEKPADKQFFELSDEEKRVLLLTARKAVEIKGKVSIKPESVTDNLRKNRGLFVTLTIQGELRGCIGSMSPQQPLYELIGHVAYQAAFHDPRFAPVNPDELDDIEFEITLLGPFSKVSNPKEIIIGKHGLMIRKDDRQGVLLPQVASDRSWSREEFLNAICQKAFLPKDAWQKGAELWKFSAYIFSEE